MPLLHRYLHVFMSNTFIDADGILFSFTLTFFSKLNDFLTIQNGHHFLKICCQVRMLTRVFLCRYQFSHQISDWFLVTHHSKHFKVSISNLLQQLTVLLFKIIFLIHVFIFLKAAAEHAEHVHSIKRGLESTDKSLEEMKAEAAREHKG